MATLFKDALAPLADRIQIAFGYGSVAPGKQHAHSDPDICILGDVEILDVVKALGSVQDGLRREINPVVMHTARFVDQLTQHERFAEHICGEPKIVLIGNDDEFAELVEDSVDLSE